MILKKLGFEPVVNEDTKVIVVGTLPGDESLEKNEYYAKPSNQFWNIVLQYIDPKLSKDEITHLDYDTRIQLLLDNRIGLWDVYSSANRAGSLDSNIRNEQLNNFDEILKKTSVKVFIANGHKPEKALKKIIDTDEVTITYCNGTSGSNTTKNYVDKREEWHTALNRALNN